jgi:hypothetical protein
MYADSLAHVGFLLKVEELFSATKWGKRQGCLAAVQRQGEKE